MEKQLIARGQATILVQKDSYTIHQSVGEYIFPANNNGALSQAVTFSSAIKVTLGDDNVTNFSIGTVTKPAGFSAITVNNTNKTVTYSVATGTTTMADSGLVTIPVLIAGQTFNVAFSYAKAKTGAAGVDSNMLDWVSDWNSAKTVIGSQSVITPKIFAGVKNSNNTVTGVAIGKFPLSTVNASGAVATETINGIYGFKDGYKTFAIDSTGSVLLGKGNQFIRYNPANGKIEFGSEVTLNWVNAINTAKTEAINSATSTAQTKADAAKNAAIAAAATDAANKVNSIEIGGDNLLPNGDFRFYSVNNSIGWDNALNGNLSLSDWGSGYNGGVAAPSTGYHAHLNTSKFGFPVLELINKNSTVNQLRRWLGISSSVYQKEKLVPGARYTFSADVMADTAGAFIHGGVYSTQTGQTNTNFHSGMYQLAPSAINKWQRVSYTFTLDAQIDTSKSISFYIYSYSGTEGICWVKNVSLQMGTKGTWVRCVGDVAKDIEDAKKAGTDAKAVADAITAKASNEGWATKLTYIGSTGIFTGTLSANIINAIQLNASQITGGTINAARIDVNSLKASLITAGNIEALTLNVVRGKVGGWSIDSDSIYSGTKNNAAAAYTAVSGAVTIGSNGIRGFKWKLDATGAGALAGGNISWDAAGNVTFGSSVVLNWTAPIATLTTALGGATFPKMTNISGTGIYTGTLTAAQVNAVAINATSIAAGTLSVDRIGAKAITAAKIAAGTITAAEINVANIQASVVTATVVNGLTCTFAKGTIAGWNINASQIYKNSVYLGSDGSITNGTKWKFNNDGSGQIAGGNISWNASGTVSFSETVSLNWTNAIQAAKSSNYGYRYYKKIVINGESGKYYPVIIKGGDQTVKRDLLVRRSYSEQGPADWESASTTHIGGLTLLIKTNFGGWGGSSYSWDIYELSEVYARMFAGAGICGNCCMFAIFLRGGGSKGAVYHIYSDQPLDSDVYSPSPIPASPQIAYNSDLIFKSPRGATDFYLENAPVPRTLTSGVENEIRRHRFIALAQSNDSTLAEHPLTYIGATGIYTGTLTAVQVNAVEINASSIKAGTLSADRLAAGSIKADKLDAVTLKSNIINTAYINGLSCTFTKGVIGGWSIAAGSIASGQLIIDSTNKRVAVYGSGSSSTSGQRVQIYHNSNSDFGIFATDTAGTAVFQLGSANKIAGWTINSSQIYKNNIYLGADGSITNSTKWKLNNDGSGNLASGKIIWDAAGNMSFGASVSLLWTNAANKGKLFARGTGLNHNSNRLVYLNGNQILSSSMRGLTLTVIKRSDLTVVSSVNYDVYGNETICNSLAAALNALSSENIVVLTSNDAISINPTLNAAIQRCGGSDLLVNSSRNPYALVGIPTVGKDNGLVSVYGVDATEPYAEIATVIFNGTPQGVNVYGRQKTYIDGNGIYTGTLSAGQVRVDTTLVVGGSTYNGSISVRDANNNVGVTLDRSGITAVAGRIGGWHLASGAIYASSPAGGHRVFITSSGYLYNDDGSQDYWGLRSDGSATFGYGKILFDNDGSGYVANQNIKWDSKGNVEIKGNITANSGLIAGFTISGNKLINTASDSSIEFSSMMGNASMTINSYSSLLSLRADSARTGISIQTYATGAVGLSIVANAGSNYAIEAYGPVQFGQRAGERWCVPGVLYIGCKYNSGNSPSFSKIWGEGCNVTSSYHLGNAQYKFYHNLGHTNYTVFAQGCQNTGYYGFFRLLERASSYFVIQNVGSNGGPDGSPFDFIIYGRNKWY